MVEAVAMRTSGLGGDSQVHFITEGLMGGVRLGPRRVVPVSLLASEAGDIVHATLDQQLANPVPNEYDGCFVRRLQNMPSGGLTDRDAAVLDRIGDHVKPLNTVLKIRLETQSLRRLLARGLVQLASVTASDASHALGWATAWDRPAAEKTLRLFGRQRTGAGEMLAKDPQTMARIIVDQLTQQTVLALLETAFGVPRRRASTPCANAKRP